MDILQILAYPAVLLLLGLFAIGALKGPFARYVDRAERIRFRDLEATAPQQQTLMERISAKEELLTAFDSPVVLEREMLIRQFIEGRGIEDPKEQTDVLVRYLAHAQVEREFEIIYSNILGSQIAILEALNSTAKGKSNIELTAFYEIARKDAQEYFSDYPFEKYIGFLVAWTLIEEREEENQFFITAYGRYFLTYLAKEGRSRYRPF